MPEKMTSFCFPEWFLCFRVRVSGYTFKYVFGQTFIWASGLDLHSSDRVNTKPPLSTNAI